ERAVALSADRGGFLLGFHFGDWLGSEQIGVQMTVQDRVMATQPLQRHRGMLLFLVPVVGEYCCQRCVVGRRYSLVVPVDSLQLPFKRTDRSMAVNRRRVERVDRLVETFARHAAPPWRVRAAVGHNLPVRGGRAGRDPGWELPEGSGSRRGAYRSGGCRR